MSSETFKKITERVIASLAAGTVPWKKPWMSGLPRSMATGFPYQGINVFLLWNNEFSSPWWGTRRQIEEHQGTIKPDAKPYFVLFSMWRQTGNKEKQGAGEAAARFGFSRLYEVFNADQCDGLMIRKPSGCPDKFVAAAAVCAGYDQCRITRSHDVAGYNYGLDEICMPPRDCFDSLEEYYVTLFHEMAHSTGHHSRLNRKECEKAVSSRELYSKEELVAEMTACFLCAETGIDSEAGFRNQVAYIDSWLSVLKNDSRLLISAAAQAQKAANFILGRKLNERRGRQDGKKADDR